MDEREIKKEFHEVAHKLADHMIFGSPGSYKNLEVNARYEELMRIVRTYPKRKQKWFFETIKE